MFIENEVALKEFIYFQDTKHLFGSDKPISNLPCNFTTLYQGVNSSFADYRFKVSQRSCSILEIGTI